MSQVENSIMPTPLDGWSQIQGVQIATELPSLGREVPCKTCSASVYISFSECTDCHKDNKMAYDDDDAKHQYRLRNGL